MSDTPTYVCPRCRLQGKITGILRERSRRDQQFVETSEDETSRLILEAVEDDREALDDEAKCGFCLLREILEAADTGDWSQTSFTPERFELALRLATLQAETKAMLETGVLK